MNKYLEYAKLALKGLKNPEKIIEGWVNDAKLENGDLEEEEVMEILKRRSICSSCPYNSINAQTSIEYKTAFKEPYITERNDLHCSLCGCPDKKKTASLHSACAIVESEILKGLGVLPKWNVYNKTK